MRWPSGFAGWMLAVVACVVGAFAGSAMLLWQTRDFPGIISQRPGQGSWELLQYAAHLPPWQALAVLALAAGIIGAALWTLAGFMDPHGHARDAVAWPLRARGSTVVAILAAVALSWAERHLPYGDFLLWIGLLVVFAVPFCSWMPAALEGGYPRLRRPAWPGVMPVLAAVALLLWQAASDWLLDGIHWPVAWMQGAAFAASSLISALLMLLLAAFWLRGTWPVREPVSAFLRQRVLAEYLWLLLAWSFFAGLVLLPWLTLVVQMIFVLPTLREMSEALPHPFPASLHWQAQVGSHFMDTGSFYASALGSWYIALSLGRWLWARRVQAE